MSNELNDSLDDLIGERSDVARVSQPSRPVPASFVPDRTFVEGCPKCRGSGRTPWGPCFKCKGVGSRTFKTSAADRAANRQSAHERRNERKTAEVRGFKDAFKAAEPELWTWMQANCDKFGFANKMLETISTYGSLTVNQRAAVVRCMEGDKARAAQRAERAQQAPEADAAGVDRLKASFDKAKAYAAEHRLTMKTPKITIGNLLIYPAGDTSKNPGALYVKDSGEYLGKIQNGRWFGIPACTPAQKDQLLAFIADPKAAAEAYGQTTGTCCICNATLTSEWKLRGIGPICAQKFGW